MIGNKELLLMVNVLLGQKLLVEFPMARVLGSILFVIFINYIEDEEKDVGVMIRKYVKASSQCVTIFQNLKYNFGYDQENVHL